MADISEKPPREETGLSEEEDHYEDQGDSDCKTDDDSLEGASGRPQDLQLTGDVLVDVRAAEEMGLGVSIITEGPGEIDKFMNGYGISFDTGIKTKKKRDWLKAQLPEYLWWIAEIRVALNDAWARALTEDGVDADGGAAGGGIRQRLQMLSTPTDGKVPEGSLQIAWSMFRMACRFISTTASFQYFFGCLIVINTIYMGVQADNDWDLPAVDHLFVFLFFFEVVVRMTATEHFLIQNAFLYFDTAIVLISVGYMWLLPLILQINTGSHLRLLHVFRIIRIVRLTRLLRLISFLKPLRVMERSFRSGIAHFVSIVGFLTAYLYAASLVFASVFKLYNAQQAYGDIPEQYCGSVIKLMMYLFEAMFCGFDWWEKMVNPLLEHRSTRTTGVLLIVFIFASKLALANLFTSSLVENYFTTMQLDNLQNETEELYDRLDVQGFRQLVWEVDERNLGRISWHMFVTYVRVNPNGPKLLKMLGIRPKFEDESEEMEQLLEMWKVFQSMDLAGEDAIPYEVMSLGYVKLKGSKKQVQGLLIDFVLKQVLLLVRRNGHCLQPMERHIAQIDSQIMHRVRDLKYIQIDTDEAMRPVNERLCNLENKFKELKQSLQLPVFDAEVVPAACATIATMTLQNEMEALKKVAENFIKSQGSHAGHCSLLSEGRPLLSASTAFQWDLKPRHMGV